MFGFALAWWLASAPLVANFEWKLAIGSDLSNSVRAWLGGSYVLMIMGVLVAATIIGASECEQLKRVSRWFLVGLLWLPLLLFVLP